jgi:hypothetical protein
MCRTGRHILTHKHSITDKLQYTVEATNIIMPGHLRGNVNFFIANIIFSITFMYVFQSQHDQ